MSEKIMARFNSAKAFKQIRRDSRREKLAAEKAWRRKREEWAAFGRRRAAMYQLIGLFAREGREGDDYTVDVQKATALMVAYAQTLPGKWVKACLKFVMRRLAELAAEERLGKQEARFKGVLLNLLLFANAGNDAKVAEIFSEAVHADPSDLETFRHYLVNWLMDKVVDTWPPVPEELKQPSKTAQAEVPPNVGSTMAPQGEWLPASRAVERAEYHGHHITLKWLTQDAHKHGVHIRPRQQRGRHKKEVEWRSLAGFLMKPAPSEKELDEEALSHRLSKARAQKRKECSLE
jgi:hypothetical protein